MNRAKFFRLYPKGELFTVKGKLVIVKGYVEGTGLAVVENENGDTESVGVGLLRRVS